MSDGMDGRDSYAGEHAGLDQVVLAKDFQKFANWESEVVLLVCHINEKKTTKKGNCQNFETPADWLMNHGTLYFLTGL